MMTPPLALLAMLLFAAPSHGPSPTPVKAAQENQNQGVSVAPLRIQQQRGNQAEGKRPTDWLAVAATALNLLFTGLLVILMYQQWLSMEKQADYMRDGLAENRKPAEAAAQSAAAPKGIGFRVTIPLVNGGSTPATIVSGKSGYFVGKELPEVPDYAECVENLPSLRVVQGNSIHARLIITPEDRERIHGGLYGGLPESVLFVYGRIDYIDAFSDSHAFAWARAYHGQSSSGIPAFVFQANPAYEYQT